MTPPDVIVKKIICDDQVAAVARAVRNMVKDGQIDDEETIRRLIECDEEYVKNVMDLATGSLHK